MSDATCHHTAEEIREMAYLVWLKDQTTLIEQALSEEALETITDAWNAYREDGGSRYSEAMDNFVRVIMGVVENNDD